MHTVMCFYPCPQDFTVTRDLLERLLAYFQADYIQVLSAQNYPSLWDREIPEPAERGEEYFQADVPIDEALRVWESGRFLVTVAGLPFQQWARDLADEIEREIPPSVRGDCITWDVFITLGPWSEPTWDESATAATGRFRLSIGGDGYPPNVQEYARLFSCLPRVVQLRAWLQALTGSEWDVLLALR